MKGLTVIIPVKPPEPYLPRLLDQIYHNLVLLKIPHEFLIQKEKGLTNAVIKGVQLARYNIIAVMDADGTHHPLFLVPLYFGTDYYDLVIASRFGQYEEMSRLRGLISRIYCWFARTLLDLNVKDPMSGFVVGAKEVFKCLKPSSDYKFLLQLLIWKPSFRVLELPFTFQKRQKGKSKATFRTGLKTFLTIILLWWNKQTKNI